jgi:hypothetical protein
MRPFRRCQLAPVLQSLAYGVATLCAVAAAMCSENAIAFSFLAMAVAYGGLMVAAQLLESSRLAVVWTATMLLIPLIMNVIDCCMTREELVRGFVNHEPEIRHPARLIHFVSGAVHAMMPLSLERKRALVAWSAAHFAFRGVMIYLRADALVCALHVVLNPIFFFHSGVGFTKAWCQTAAGKPFRYQRVSTSGGFDAHDWQLAGARCDWQHRHGDRCAGDLELAHMHRAVHAHRQVSLSGKKFECSQTSNSTDTMVPSPPPSPPSLQYLVMLQVVTTVLNGEDVDARDDLIHAIEQGSGYTLRNSIQEGAVRELVQLADVKASHGFAEDVSLDDASSWVQGNFVQLRPLARLLLSEQTLAEFLCDAYQNSTVSIDDGFECIEVPPGNNQGWPSGCAAVFYTSREPHSGIQETLAALEMASATTTYNGRCATLAFLSTSPLVKHNSDGSHSHVNVRSWDNREPVHGTAEFDVAAAAE